MRRRRPIPLVGSDQLPLSGRLIYGQHWCWSDDFLRFWYELDPEIKKAWKIAGIGLAISAILIGYAISKED